MKKRKQIYRFGKYKNPELQKNLNDKTFNYIFINVLLHENLAYVINTIKLTVRLYEN